MKTFTRRQFLHRTLVAGTAVSVLPTMHALGANEAVRLGIIGFNGRGERDMNGFLALPNLRVTALCDVDQNVLDRVAKKLSDGGGKVETHRDLRKLLESKNVDAVVIATPNHWHTLAAIWAMQAGK